MAIHIDTFACYRGDKLEAEVKRIGEYPVLTLKIAPKGWYAHQYLNLFLSEDNLAVLKQALDDDTSRQEAERVGPEPEGVGLTTGEAAEEVTAAVEEQAAEELI